MELSVHSIHVLIQRSSKFLYTRGKFWKQGGERAMFFDQTHSPAENINTFLKKDQRYYKISIEDDCIYLKITPEDSAG